MSYKLLLSSLVCLLCFFDVCLTYRASKLCKIPNGDGGTCVLMAKCDPLRDLHDKKHQTTQEKLFLRQAISQCTLSSVSKIRICCPPPSLWSTLKIDPVLYPSNNEALPAPLRVPDLAHAKPVDPVDSGTDDLGPRKSSSGNDDDNSDEYGDTCGLETSSANKIVGGGPAAIDQYPWLGLLEYGNNARMERGEAFCAGNLVTTRFVLTAAHCLNTKHGQPQVVRLAEYDTSTFPRDCVETDGGGEDCIIETRIAVKSIHSHPNYNSGVNDIGLIYMAEKAIFSDFIKPICLPEVDFTARFTKQTNLTVAGWGSDGVRLETEVKMAVDLPYVPQDECEMMEVNNNQICAGGEAGRDSCGGDSGGALMLEHDNSYYAVGIVSYGDNRCGVQGRPGVYTNVFRYMTWIKSVIDKRIKNSRP